MTSKTPAGQLPAILANPSTGIVNSKLVKQHGGTASVGADKKDKAEAWLNSSSSVGAGSGPYVLSAYSTTSQVTLKRNTKYWGATKPAFDTVVVRNMVAATQLINVGRGSHEVAIDLASDQAQTLKSNSKVKVSLQPSTWVFWLFANNDPAVSAVTSNKQWQNAIRFGLDYKSILSAWPVPARTRRRGSSRRCSRARCPRRRRSSRTSRRRRRRCRRRGRRVRASRSSTRAT